MKPKISIVTACYNGAEYLECCIRSIMNQTYDNVEHIIVDGGSTDGSLEIIRRYEGQYNMRWISEKDNGMYDAIYKGFCQADGEIFAWLNADDCYMPWTCEVMAKVMGNTEVKWCTGIPGILNERGVLYGAPAIAPVYPRAFLKRGYMDGRIAPFLQQESTFWRRELWEKYGSCVLDYQSAGDYHLWRNYAKTESLFTLDTFLAGFRIHEGQKSGDLDKYYSEAGKLSAWTKLLCKTKVIWRIISIISIVNKKKRISVKKYL